MDYKSVFTNLCPGTSTEQVMDKGMSKNPFTHSIPFTHSLGSAFCPGAPKRVPSDSEKHRVYTRHPTFVTATSGVLTRLRHDSQKQNACLHAVRHAVEKKLRVYTASEAKGLNRKDKY